MGHLGGWPPARVGVQSQAKTLIMERSVLGPWNPKGVALRPERPMCGTHQPLPDCPRGGRVCSAHTHSGMFLERRGPSGPGGGYWADREEAGMTGCHEGRSQDWGPCYTRCTTQTT